VTENLAIKSWYDYNWLTHVLWPKPHVYAVRTADGSLAAHFENTIAVTENGARIITQRA
jgi:methionine aminopeptidase